MVETHNFELSEEQTMVLDQVRKFAQDQVEPNALEHDEHRRFVRQNFDQLAEMGMLGLPLAEDSGGAGFGMLAFVVALEKIAASCGSTARLLLSRIGMISWVVAPKNGPASNGSISPTQWKPAVSSSVSAERASGCTWPSCAATLASSSEA